MKKKELIQLISGSTLMLIGFVVGVSNLSLSDTQREIASLQNREVHLQDNPWELNEKELETINAIADSLAEKI